MRLLFLVKLLFLAALAGTSTGLRRFDLPAHRYDLVGPPIFSSQPRKQRTLARAQEQKQTIDGSFDSLWSTAQMLRKELAKRHPLVTR